MSLPALSKPSSDQNLPTRKQVVRLFNGPTGRKIVHEAGHAFMAAKFAAQPTFTIAQSPKAPDRPHGIMLALHPYRLSRVRYGRRYEDEIKGIKEALCLLGGLAAEMLLYPGGMVTDHADITRAQELLEQRGYGATQADIDLCLKRITAELQTWHGEELMADLMMGIAMAYLQHKTLPQAVIPGLN